MDCNKCGKKGTFCVCNSAVSEVRKYVVPEVAAAAYDKVQCNVKIEAPIGDSHVLELVVDTGASVSILPEAIYKECFENCTLTEPQIKLVTYSQREVPVIGCLPATVAIAENEKRASTSFHIVKAGPLLGLDLIKEVNVNIIVGKVNFIAETDSNTTSKNIQDSALEMVHLAAPQQFGSVKGFTHKVQVNKTVQPVRQKLRRFPLSIRKEVSTEINRLLQTGIIERVDASEWLWHGDGMENHGFVWTSESPTRA